MPTPPYKNPALSPERRTQDLLARMTLPEKAAQMRCLWCKQFDTFLNAQGHFDPAKARQAFKKGEGLGQIARPSDAGPNHADPRHMAQLTNDLQKFFRENSRLGIPLFFHEECLHGHAAPGATSFPQPIGLASTFNPDLVRELFAMTALETRRRGAHQALTPVVDVARDPRWGRVEETYGEDPFLVSQMGLAAIQGFQGDATFQHKRNLVATLKHFVAHGSPEGGMNCAPANIALRDLHEFFLSTFKAALCPKKGPGAISLMASYNEVDGIPSHANTWLLRDLLRKTWGFTGFIVSDYFAIWELNDRPDTHGHRVARDKKEACKLSVEAGVNIELPFPDAYLHLEELVKKGQLQEKQLDELIAPMLLWKFKMGLFEDPYVDVEEAVRVTGSAEHAALALRAAHETITLLKNDGPIAPLDISKLKTLAVIGPNADRCLLGGYSGTPPHTISVLEGLRNHAAIHLPKLKILHAEGCKITRPSTWEKAWYQDEVIPADPAEDRKLIAQAEKIAKRSDTIILCLGGNEQTAREAWNRRHMGDRASLELLGSQNALIDALAKLGKPIIALLFNGRPLALTNLVEKIPTIFECWYLGQETGRAVADVLFGHINPSGKLPISFPRSAGHLPVFYNHKPSARRGYLFDDATPLFPFGFGLSYTTFQLGKPRLEKSRIKKNQSTRLHIPITNTGKHPGTEVLQLYIRDLFSSATRSVKELKAFQRITLNPGQKATATLAITPDSLAFFDAKMNYTVEPGEFEIQIGTSCRDHDLQKLILEVT